MSRRTIQTTEAPAAVGPYSQAVIACRLLFTSMQIALNPKTGEMRGETATEQVAQCLDNLGAVLVAAGASFDAVVKTTVYVTDIGQFASVNHAYAKYFTKELPARGVVEVGALPKGALIGIEAIATLSE